MEEQIIKCVWHVWLVSWYTYKQADLHSVSKKKQCLYFARVQRSSQWVMTRGSFPASPVGKPGSSEELSSDPQGLLARFSLLTEQVSLYSECTQEKKPYSGRNTEIWVHVESHSTCNFIKRHTRSQLNKCEDKRNYEIPSWQDYMVSYIWIWNGNWWAHYN